MPIFSRPGRAESGNVAWWEAYGFAVCMVLLAWGGTYLLKRVVPDRHFSLVLFFAAVALSAGLGGLRAGILATLLSALACDYFFLPPFHTFVVTASDLPLLVLFLVVALLINGLSGRLQAQTRHADARFYRLVQGLDAIVWEANPRTRQFTFVSQRAETLLGYSIREWLTDPHFRSRITHPSDRDHVLAVCHHALTEGGEHSVEYRVLKTSGEEVWLRETVDVTHNGHRQPSRMTGLAIDITERKIASEELSLLKDELALLNSITSAVSASLELPEFLAILQNQLQEQLHVEGGCIFLAEESGDSLVLASSWGVPEPLVSEWPGSQTAPRDALPPAGGAADAPSAMTAKVSEMRTVPELQRHGWTEALAIPLLASDALRGGLILFSKTSFRADGNRLAFFAALGRQAGTLLHNATLYQQVHNGREHLQRLSRQLVQVQESERRAIARELHDEIGQVLTGLKLTLETGARLPPESRSESLQKALGMIQELMKQVDALSLDLRPAMLDELGLLPSLFWHCERYTSSCGVRVLLEHSGLERRFPAEAEITAYRIIQEALTNIARHAGVNEASVRLWSTREIMGIQVADRGFGFDMAISASDKTSGGLAGMQERVSLLGGDLSIETTPGTGTCITVELPITGQRVE